MPTNRNLTGGGRGTNQYAVKGRSTTADPYFRATAATRRQLAEDAAAAAAAFDDDDRSPDAATARRNAYDTDRVARFHEAEADRIDSLTGLRARNGWSAGSTDTRSATEIRARVDLAAYRNQDEPVYEILAVDRHPDVRATVARNPHAASQHRRLVNDTDVNVRAGVAETTSDPLIAQLSFADENPHVRARAVRNPALGRWRRLQARRDPSAEVRRQARLPHRYPAGTLDELSWHSTVGVRAEADPVSEGFWAG